MKSFIVDFKMDSELNSVSQNSPFFTPRCKIQVWATIGQGDRPPADQVVRTTEPSLFSPSHWMPPNLTAPMSDLQVLHSISTPRISRSLLLGPTSCGELQAAFPAGPKKRHEVLPIWGSEEQVSTLLLSLQRRGATLCRLSSNPDSKNSIQHWNPNLLLQPPAPFLQVLVTLN